MIFSRASLTTTEAEVRWWIADYCQRTDKMAELEAMTKAALDDMNRAEMWCDDTNKYVVSVYRKVKNGFNVRMTHLSIRRRDRAPIHDWRDLQIIKNQICGPEREAVELYPAESRLMDAANQYHLWVFDEPNKILPLGFHDPRNVNDEAFGNAKQRGFK